MFNNIYPFHVAELDSADVELWICALCFFLKMRQIDYRWHKESIIYK